MFSHINKKAMEVVLHFLFSKLDSNLSYEEFRYVDGSNVVRDVVEPLSYKDTNDFRTLFSAQSERGVSEFWHFPVPTIYKIKN